MLRESLAADLIVELPNAVRLQRLVQTLREYFNCGAVGLLRLEGDSLRPLACVGLVHEALGRRFVIAQHPRLAAIMASREPTWFEPDSRLPDPYDGLLETALHEP
ncbi:nitric oxide reductase transcription regulator, partial [Pseudomonas frederiksbergensis]|nr:nitric oxide reductase transcription regulator [Pseudomonas frederiksbergensis]